MNFELPETIDNSLYTSENLQSIVITSDKFGSLSVFPQQNQMIGGASMFQSISIKESIFSPVVSGKLIVYDIGSFIENYNIEGFEDITISFKKIKDGNAVTFSGIITDVTLLTNDSVLNNRMNADEYVRIFSLTFMNKDLFIANYVTPQDPDPEGKNPYTPKDWVGWISRKTEE